MYLILAAAALCMVFPANTGAFTCSTAVSVVEGTISAGTSPRPLGTLNSTSNVQPCTAPRRVVFRHTVPVLREFFAQPAGYPVGVNFTRSMPQLPFGYYCRLRRLMCGADGRRRRTLRLVVLGGSVPAGIEIPAKFGGPWPRKLKHWCVLCRPNA